MRRALTSSSQELLGRSKPNLLCSIYRINRQGTINFMTHSLRGGSFGMKSVELMYLFKNSFLSLAWFTQTKYIVMITKEEIQKLYIS